MSGPEASSNSAGGSAQIAFVSTEDDSISGVVGHLVQLQLVGLNSCFDLLSYFSNTKLFWINHHCLFLKR